MFASISVARSCHALGVVACFFICDISISFVVALLPRLHFSAYPLGFVAFKYAASDSRRGKFRALGAPFLALSARCFRSSRAPFFGSVASRSRALGARAFGARALGLALSGLSVAPRWSRSRPWRNWAPRPWRGGECSGYLTREKCYLWKSQSLSTRYPQPPVDNRDFGGPRRKIYSLSVAIRTLSVAVNSLSVAAEINPAVS